MTTDVPNTQCGTTRLPGPGLTISRLGLGFAHAHLLDSFTRSALVNQALDLGITHFDTARFYSDGLSEKVLGRALAGKRSSVTITSKFGLLPTPMIGSMGTAAMPARKVRSLLNKLRLVSYPRRSYSPEVMRRALQASLRALNTDYLDIYHVHEPLPGSAISDDLITELQKAKAAGSIRAVGVSGLAGNIDAIIARYGGAIDVIQSSESGWQGRSWVPDITHSLFAEAARTAPGGVLPSESVRRLLTDALRRRPEGAVVVQTSNTARLAQLVEFAAG